jgi:hypothetical protein
VTFDFNAFKPALLGLFFIETGDVFLKTTGEAG